MITFDDLKDSNYLFKDYTIGFAEGRRSLLRYVLESGHAYYTRVNLSGPQPFEYLDYAKRDINSQQNQGTINSLGNAKRAIHLTIDTLFEVWGLNGAYAKANFPTKLELMEMLDVFPIRLVDNLNKKRNLIEHEYQSINIDEAKDLIEITEMFLMLAHPYLKHATISAFVGVEQDERCLEWWIDIYKCQISIYEVTCHTFIDTPVGRVYHSIPIEEKDRELIQTISINKSNRDEWITYLDLFVYLTKRNAHFLPKPGGREEGLYVSRSELHMM